MFPSLSCNWVSSQCDCAFSLLFLEITARAEVMFSGGLLETWALNLSEQLCPARTGPAVKQPWAAVGMALPAGASASFPLPRVSEVTKDRPAGRVPS